MSLFGLHIPIWKEAFTGQEKPLEGHDVDHERHCSTEVASLAFAPLSLIHLKALACIESIAADAHAALHSMCFFCNKDR